uniref:Wax synthase domain-containing protein n=1 Tax=Ditylum brightwellii TaxID=49249 RepID=A0A7S4QSP9_9STRA|mmetsp:Transcript_272/g.333  ORF Transcript_272/g.333 Transcript_272/m.333 type:complete len:440 (+) Transcript_272:112-1431(+)
MMSLLYNLFEDKLEMDHREPFPIFSLNQTTLPTFLRGNDEDDDNMISVGVVTPVGTFYAQLLFLIIVQRIIAAFCSILIYNYIIVNSRHPQKTMSTTASFLIGFGVILPIMLQSPFWFVNVLDIRSKAMRLLLLSLPLTGTLRLLEAFFGFTPQEASSSLQNYMVYFTTLVDVEFDSKTQKPIYATSQDLMLLSKQCFLSSLKLVVALCIFAPMSYTPFETGVLAHSTNHTFADIWSWMHILNNFVAATILSFSLEFGSNNINLLIEITTGIKTKQMVNNPMFASTSVSDFWGSRWNNLIHVALKRGVYKPVRKYCNKRSIAAAATFLASGILHEYCWGLLFYVHDNEKDYESGFCSNCVYPHYGKNVIFFGWNGVLIVFEYLLSQFYFVRKIRTKLPNIIITAMVLITALPIGHLFTGDWVAAGYYEQIQMAFPMFII